MRVHMIFEFPDITDPNSPEADEIVERLTGDTVGYEDALTESGYKCLVWVDDATGEASNEDQ